MNLNSTSFLLPFYPEASGHSPRGGNLARPKPGSTGHFLFPLAAPRYAAPRIATLRNATLFFKSLHDLSRNFTNRNQPVRSVFRAVAGAGSLPGPPSLPFFKIDHVRHSVPSVSLAHNNETKGRSVAWMQKGFAKS